MQEQKNVGRTLYNPHEYNIRERGEEGTAVQCPHCLRHQRVLHMRFWMMLDCRNCFRISWFWFPDEIDPPERHLSDHLQVLRCVIDGAELTDDMRADVQESLKAIRTLYDKTQAEVAEALDYAERTVTDYEKYISKPLSQRYVRAFYEWATNEL